MDIINKEKKFVHKLKDVLLGNYTFLLFSLILLFILFPLVDDSSNIVLGLLFTFILLASVYTIISSKKFLFVGCMLLFLSIIANWLTVSFPEIFLIKVLNLIQPIFFVFISIVIIHNLFTQEDVTLDMIMGSICAYLFIGLAFCMFYEFLLFLNKDAFIFNNNNTDAANKLFYFSYVTLTTLGYGDITPRTELAKSVSCIEAIVGQFYIAIMVARLVGLHLMNTIEKNHQKKDRKKAK